MQRTKTQDFGGRFFLLLPLGFLLISFLNNKKKIISKQRFSRGQVLRLHTGAFEPATKPSDGAEVGFTPVQPGAGLIP